MRATRVNAEHRDARAAFGKGSEFLGLYPLAGVEPAKILRIDLDGVREARFRETHARLAEVFLGRRGRIGAVEFERKLLESSGAIVRTVERSRSDIDQRTCRRGDVGTRG